MEQTQLNKIEQTLLEQALEDLLLTVTEQTSIDVNKLLEATKASCSQYYHDDSKTVHRRLVKIQVLLQNCQSLYRNETTPGSLIPLQVSRDRISGDFTFVEFTSFDCREEESKSFSESLPLISVLSNKSERSDFE